MIDHRRQRGRLAAPGGAGDEDEALGLFAEPREIPWQAQLLEAEDPVRDQSHRRRHAVVLAEHVDAQASDPRHRVSEVDVQAVAELGAAALVEGGLEGGAHRVRARDPRVGDLDQAAVEAPARTMPLGQVEIGDSLRRHAPDPAVEVGRAERHGGRLRDRGMGGRGFARARLARPIARAAERCQRLIEEARRDPDRSCHQSGKELAHAFERLRGRIVHEAEGENVELGF